MQKIIHVVTIKVSSVFNAITTTDRLSNWWTTDVNADEEVGGIVDFKFITGFNPDMKITELRKSEKVGWKCVSGHDPWQDNRFTFQLTDINDGTQLKFTQEYANEISDGDYRTYNFNWGYYLESLRNYCETGQGKTFAA